jgi:8-oxo-dGTP pyrophosphatase MutT (NUDIX family)
MSETANTTALDGLADFERELRVRLTQPLPGAEAQRRFAPTPARSGWAPHLQPADARRAAALLLVYPGATDPTLVLTVRHEGLPQHAGQISLPGGAIDPGESAEAAALREAAEEIGVTADQVRIAGALSPLWIPVSNFVVTPIVGVADTRPVFRLHPDEVSGLIEVSLPDLRDVTRVGWAQRQRLQQTVDYPFIGVGEHGEHQVWGATAMILSEFLCLFE